MPQDFNDRSGRGPDAVCGAKFPELKNFLRRRGWVSGERSYLSLVPSCRDGTQTFVVLPVLGCVSRRYNGKRLPSREPQSVLSVVGLWSTYGQRVVKIA